MNHDAAATALSALDGALSRRAARVTHLRAPLCRYGQSLHARRIRVGRKAHHQVAERVDEVQPRARLACGGSQRRLQFGDEVADATRINRMIETAIRMAPAQYLWMHKRFKTRPPGEKAIY